MPRPAGPSDAGSAVGDRCSHCGAEVEGTRHGRADYTVGHFVLHTGRTVAATVRRGDDEAPLTFLRVTELTRVVACPACFRLPEVQRRWRAFGDDPGAETA